jgi:ATP synthase protein I
VVERPESRSSLALGMEWASRVTTIGVEFALPMLLGYGADRWLGTLPVATVAGLFLGVVVGLVQTVRLARQLPGGSTPSRPSRGDREARGSPEDGDHS